MAKRDSRCLALGTTHSLDYNKLTKDFIDYFKVNTWHYNREELYNNKNKLSHIMNIKIERYDENLKNHKNKLINYIQNILFMCKQKKYMSFDIVKEYNKHQFFISPEERAFLPSINFVEGMSCCCIFIGIESDIYTYIGMKSGEHYIGYDGSINDLINKIQFYQNNNFLSMNMHKKSIKFASDNFDKEKLKRKFLELFDQKYALN